MSAVVSPNGNELARIQKWARTDNKHERAPHILHSTNK